MYVVIAGGGLIGGSLAKRLIADRHDVVVIEQDKSVCQAVAASSGALVLHGEATDIDILEESGLRKAEVAVAALPFDAGNLAFALLAREFEVPRIMARMRNPRYETAYRLAGVSRMIDVGDLFVRNIILEIEQPTLRQVATFGSGKGAIVMATIPERSHATGRSVREIGEDSAFPEACLIAGIYRGDTDEFIIPRGAVVVNAGDTVFLTADTNDIRKAAAYLQKKK